MKSFQKYKDFLTKSHLGKVIERINFSDDFVLFTSISTLILNATISLASNVGIIGLFLFNSFIVAPIFWKIFFNKKSWYFKTKEECLFSFKEIVSNQENQKIILSFFIEGRDFMKSIAEKSSSDKRLAIERSSLLLDKFISKISCGQIDKECMTYFYKIHCFLMNYSKSFEELSNKIRNEEYIKKIMSTNDVLIKEDIHEKEMAIGEYDNFKVKYKL